MYRLDDLLLDRIYQPICDRLFDTIGDCIVIARRMLMHGVAATACISCCGYSTRLSIHAGFPRRL